MRRTVGLIALIGLLTGCTLLNQSQPTLEVIVPQAVATSTPEAPLGAETSPLPEPTVAALPGLLFFEGIPDYWEAGQMIELPLRLVSYANVAEMTIEVHFPLPYLQVMDAQPDVEGVQVRIPALPEAAVVEMNAISAEGVLTYRVRNLGTAAEMSHTLLVASVQAVAPPDEVLALEFWRAEGLDVAGNALELTAQTPLVQIVPAAQAPAAQAPALVSQSQPRDGGVPAGIYYRVQEGQTLTRIAATFGSTAEAIAAENGLPDPAQAPAGMVVRIPVAAPVGQAAYFIAPRDTLYAISTTLRIPVEQLAAMNQLTVPYAIQGGRWLILRP